MDNPKVSVIVPVYKSEQYIERCINSILIQSYDNTEIILVDDGSPDNCPLICDEYKNKDDRVTVIHQKNSGPAVARNVGISIADGKYITFVDSDDYISTDYIKCMVNVAESYNADIVSCDYSIKVENIEQSSNPDVYKVYSSEEAICTLMQERILYTGPVGKMINQRIMDDIRFPAELMHEDLAIVYRLFDKSNMIVHLNNIMYYYEANPDSITHSVFSMKKLDLFVIMDEIIDFTSKNYPRATKFAHNRDTRYAISYYKQAATVSNLDCSILPFLRDRIRPNILKYQLSRYSVFSKLYGILICLSPRLSSFVAKKYLS